MLIDLLDKIAKAENDLITIKEFIPNISNDNTKLNIALAESIKLIDNIRNYKLILINEKTKIKTEISNQTFNLLELDCLAKSIEDKINVINRLLTFSKDVFTLVKERNILQADLDLINKTSDAAIWKAEFSNG